MAVTDITEFTAILAREIGPDQLNAYQVGRLANDLMHTARALQRYAEKDCNEGLNDAERARVQRMQETTTANLRAFHVYPAYSNDPRGAVLKLLVPSGRLRRYWRRRASMTLAAALAGLGGATARFVR